MGKITPQFFLLSFIFGLLLLSANTAIANLTYGPEKPALKEQQYKKNLFFVGFLLEAAPSITLNENSPASCSDENDGSLSINVSGGVTPYTYSWTGPGNSYANNSSINNLTPGTYTVTVTDDNSEQVSKSFTVTFEDNIKPEVITQNITVQLDASGKASITEDAVNNGSSDACGGLTFDTDITSFDCGDIGANTVNLTVTDANGNSASKNATVTVQDKVAPTAITQNIIVQLDASGNASITEDAVNNGSSDACGGLTFDTDITSFDCGDIGANTVNLTVTDANGNSASKNATVTVQDKVNPTAITQNIIVQLDASGNASITEDAVNNGSSDACGGLTFDTDITSFDCGDIGANTVNLTVTDANGNSASKSATVTVDDNIVPTQPSLPKLEWKCGTAINEFPTTIDNCSTTITGTTTDPLEFSGYGEYLITWTFTDASNNSVTAIQEILVPEPTVEIPEIDDSQYCNNEEFPGITFTGNALADKSYNWSYGTSTSVDIGLAPNGTGNIPAFTAKNNSSNSVDVKFTVIPFGGNCEGREQNFTITINPTPTITTPNDIVICEGETVGIIDLSGFSVEGSTVEWTNDNPNIGLPRSGNGNIPSFTASNGTGKLEIATISLIPSANNCIGETQTFTIEVKSKPELKTPIIPELCNSVPTDAIALKGNFPGITYDITGGSSVGLSNRAGVSEIPVFTPVNNTASTVNATIKITPKANGCKGVPIEIPVTVKPSPLVDAAFTNQICSGEQTAIALSSPVANTGFTWTVEAPAGIEGAINGSFDAEETIEQELTNTTYKPQTVIYRVTPQAAGCIGATIPIKIVVNPNPKFEITDPDPVCSPAKIDLTSSEITLGSSSDLTFTYWNNEMATDKIENHKAVGAGTYYIKATTANDCSTIKPVTVIENQTPELTSPIQAPGFCSETAFEYDFSSSVAGTEFSWIRRSMNGISTPGTNGSGNINEVLVNETTNPIEIIYEVTLISPEGCSNIQEIKTTVTPTPLLTSTLTPEKICSGINFEYTPTSETGGAVFSWTRDAIDGISNPTSSGTGPINETLENTTTQSIGVTYTYTLSSNNCENPKAYNVNVVVTPAPDTQVQASKAGENNRQEEQIEICPGGSVDLFSSTSFPNNPSLPSDVLNSDFNNGNQGWNLKPDNGNARWRLTNSGEQAYIDECEWWEVIFFDCEDERIDFRSNTNDHFFLVNSSNNNGDFNNTRLISPVFNTQGYSTLDLSFWHHYRDGGARWNNQRDVGFLQYRYQNNAGNWVNWQDLDTYTSTEGDANDFVKRDYNINNLINRDAVQIRFRYHNANNDWYWAVDNISITGDGTATPPEVTWTSNTSDWTSSEENPTNISPLETTIYTATYTDPETNCPGSASITVNVPAPLQPRIVADYCAFEESNRIRLSADQLYDSYRWESAGEIISNNSSIDISLAQTYTLYVTRNNCEASTSLTPSENLIINGDFEAGNTGFNTVYRFVPPGGDLYPEGDYAVDDNAGDYHDNFYGFGHGGFGNFMIINGDRSTGNVVWESNKIDIITNTDYYFSAWTSNVNPASPARLRLQLLLPGSNNPLVESTLGDLTNEPVGNWINFYNPELWNSGNNTEVVLRIINENPTAGGNDFGIDDISFAAFRSFDFEFTPKNNGPICENETIKLTANLDGGRLPITFDWTGPDGFSHSTTVTNQEELAAADTLTIPNATQAMAGEYSLKITDFYGCNLESKTTTVEVIERAVVFAGDNMEICSNEPVIDLSSASITHPTVNSGFWITAGGDNSRFTNPNIIKTTYNPSEAEISSGEIDLILTSNQDAGAVCETVSDTINIVFNISPELELIPQDVSCFQGNNGDIEINIAENTGTSPFTYQWSDGQTGRIAENLVAGDYYVEVTDAKSCTVISHTITIKQPEELIAGTPVELKEASCFDDFGTVVAIPVSGGLFADETIKPENIPYLLEILDSEGNQITLGADQVNYDIATERFIVSGLQGGKGYTFLVSSSEDCAAEVKTFTTLTPPELNAGEIPEISECGIKTLWLSASPVDPEIGIGSWSYSNGETALLGNPNDPNTSFTGQAGETYTLTWSVSSVANASCNVSQDIDITFPPSCSQLNFDGVDDFVDLGDHYDINSSFSVEAWIKPHSISGTNTILAKRPANNLNSGYDLFLNEGAPTFRVNDISVVARNKIGTDRWYHIAAVYNQGSELKIYVDGIEIQTNSNNIPDSVLETDTPTLIGAAYAPEELTESKDHFEGYIEELRLWNTAIPIEQIRFFMNQRLEKDGENVSGTILGNNLNLPNAPETINWSNLLGYYQLLAQDNLISDGFTDNLGSIGETANGLLKNIKDMQENTAPLPYESNNSGDWHNRSTWDSASNKFWTFPNDIGIDRVTEINWNIAVQEQNIESNGRDIKLLGFVSKNGTRLIMNGDIHMGQSQTGFGTGNALTITHYLELNGHIDLNGESQLVQTEGSEISGSGSLERDQQGTASSYNYNYWSSPVVPNSSSNTYKVNQVMKDGSTTGTRAYETINFKWPHTHADGQKTNPVKISDYWINAFRARKANEYSQWEQIGSYTALKPGEGYTMKGTSGEAKIIDLQNYTFTGFPNNGTIEVSQIKPGQNYLLGNPYPSAISVEEFILDNIRDGEGRNDKNLLNGAVYFWDHFGGKTHYLSQYVGGYAVRNLLAGVPAISNDSRINATGAVSNKRAGAYIPVGQGFFVNTTQDTQPGNIDEFGTGNIVFKNSQRYFMMEKGQSFSFFLQAQDNPKTTKEREEKREDSRYKIRLKFQSPTGYHREILVGADARTSQGFDLGFDAPLIDKGPEDMYWIVGESKYVIQGVPHFNLDQSLPLGISVAQEKEFSIEIGELHNLPDIIDIYLRDNSDSTYHNLRKEAFKTNLPAGEYQDLYEIVFHDVTSTRNNKEPEEGPVDYYYSLENREFVISNPELHKIEHINIYNITGQLVDQHFGIPDIKEIHIPQKKSLSSAVYIVKIYTSAGDYAKKVIIRKN